MLLLGIVLLAATGVFTGLAIADNVSGGPDYTVTILGNDVAHMNGLSIFLAGLALALVFALAVLLVGAGVRTTRERAVRLPIGELRANQAAAERDAAAAPPPADQGAADEALIPNSTSRRARFSRRRQHLPH